VGTEDLPETCDQAYVLMGHLWSKVPVGVGLVVHVGAGYVAVRANIDIVVDAVVVVLIGEVAGWPSQEESLETHLVSYSVANAKKA
jgi:ethanolamine ammonia-lyase small subunit